MVIFAVKLALLLQYIEIFAPSRTGPLYRTAQSVIWLNNIFYLAHIITDLAGFVQYLSFLNIPFNPAVQLEPTPAIYYFTLQFLVTAAVNVLSDTVILLLPLVSTLRLQMEKRRKAAVMVVFATGFLCVPHSSSRAHVTKALVVLALSVYCDLSIVSVCLITDYPT